jgi:hypothetical protein
VNGVFRWQHGSKFMGWSSTFGGGKLGRWSKEPVLKIGINCIQADVNT